LPDWIDIEPVQHATSCGDGKDTVELAICITGDEKLQWVSKDGKLKFRFDLAVGEPSRSSIDYKGGKIRRLMAWTDST